MEGSAPPRQFAALRIDCSYCTIIRGLRRTNVPAASWLMSVDWLPRRSAEDNMATYFGLYYPFFHFRDDA
jgi:hypothetical protein